MQREGVSMVALTGLVPVRAHSRVRGDRVKLYAHRQTKQIMPYPISRTTAHAIVCCFCPLNPMVAVICCVTAGGQSHTRPRCIGRGYAVERYEVLLQILQNYFPHCGCASE